MLYVHHFLFFIYLMKLIKYRAKWDHRCFVLSNICSFHLCFSRQNKNQPQFRSEYNVYSTFQSHEPEFDYLKSLEIEEKINKIRWLPQKNAAQFLLSTNGKWAHSQIIVNLWWLLIWNANRLHRPFEQKLTIAPFTQELEILENIM